MLRDVIIFFAGWFAGKLVSAIMDIITMNREHREHLKRKKNTGDGHSE